MLNTVDDQPMMANPKIFAVKTYMPASMKTMVPIKPSTRQSLMGNLENEKMASVASTVSFPNVIFGSP